MSREAEWGRSKAGLRALCLALWGLCVALSIGCEHHVDFDQRLVDAAKAGEIEKAIDLLRRGANANARDRTRGPVGQQEYTALMWACRKGHPKIAAALLRCGADVSLKDANGTTAWLVAAEQGSVELLNLLKIASADIDHRSDDGDTALMAASRSGSEEAVITIIEWGTDLEASNLLGDTALMMAAVRGHTGVVRQLLSAGADPLRRNQMGETAFTLAQIGNRSDRSGYPEVLKLLIEAMPQEGI